jgi:hypothetical protein
MEYFLEKPIIFRNISSIDLFVFEMVPLKIKKNNIIFQNLSNFKTLRKQKKL